ADALQPLSNRGVRVLDAAALAALLPAGHAALAWLAPTPQEPADAA
ncbi:hypothetical protein GTP44_25835, partial [Duganella sp. FT50W]|nr:hypothetical protein [Duganella lactea]